MPQIFDVVEPYIAGPRGASGTIRSATAETIAAGSQATVTLGGTPQDRTMHFGLPKGDKGDKGNKGDKGDAGNGSVDSVNGKRGPDIVLSAQDVGALDVTSGDARYVRKVDNERLAEVVWAGVARSAAGVWPSGFKIDPDNPNDIYIMREEAGILRLGLYRISGGSIITDRRIQSPTSLSSTENTIMWRNGSGDVMFVVRVTSGSFYHVYNFTKDTLGPAVPIDGAFKIAENGQSVFTCDARTIRGGVGRVYEYTLASIKAGSPVKVREIDLENRNMYSKSQGMSASADSFFFALGRSNFIPGMSEYTRSGKHVETFEFDKASFGRMVTETRPSVTLDPNSYTHETEGSDYVDGVLYTGHVVFSGNDSSASRFVIVKHGTGVPVGIRQVANVSSASARPDDVNLDPEFAMSGSNVPVIERTGDIVTVGLDLVTTAAITGSQKVGLLPNGFRPSSLYRTVGRGTQAEFNISFWPDGVIRMDNIKPTSGQPAQAWTPIYATFRGGNGMTQ